MNTEFTKPPSRLNPFKNGHALIALSIFLSSLIIVYSLAIWPSAKAEDCHQEAVAAISLKPGDKFYASEQTSVPYMTYFEMCKNKNGL